MILHNMSRWKVHIDQVWFTAPVMGCIPEKLFRALVCAFVSIIITQLPKASKSNLTSSAKVRELPQQLSVRNTSTQVHLQLWASPCPQHAVCGWAVKIWPLFTSNTSSSPPHIRAKCECEHFKFLCITFPVRCRHEDGDCYAFYCSVHVYWLCRCSRKHSKEKTVF